MAVDIGGFGLRGHEGHVVERGEEDATVHGIEVEEALEVEVHGDLRARSKRALDLGRSSTNFFCSRAMRDCRFSRLIAGMDVKAPNESGRATEFQSYRM